MHGYEEIFNPPAEHLYNVTHDIDPEQTQLIPLSEQESNFTQPETQLVLAAIPISYTEFDYQ